MDSFRAVLTANPLSKLLTEANRTQKASLNALASSLEYAAQIAVGFVVTPLILAGLGSHLFGLWQILSRLAGYVKAASGQPASALKWTIASQQASTDYDDKRRSVGKAIVVWLLFLPLLALLGGVLAWYAPALLRAPAELSWVLRVTGALLVANLIVTALTGVPRSVLHGENLGYKRMSFSAALVILGGVLALVAMHFNTGLIGLAVGLLVTALLSGAIFLKVARSSLPWFGVIVPPFAEIRGYLRLSGWFLAWRLVSEVMRSGDIVELGILTSAEMVTTYTLTRYASQTVVQVTAVLVFSALPGLGGIIGTGDLQKAVRVRNEIMSITWVAAVPTVVTILLWNRTFLGLWVGAEYYAGSIPTLVVVLMVMQFVFIRNDANIIDLTLNLRRKVLIGALSTIASLVFAAILIGSFDLGIVGLGLGFIAGRSILSLAYPWLVGRFLGVSLISQLKDVLRPGLITVLLLLVALGLSARLIATTWIGLIVSVGVTIGVVSIFAFYSGLSGGQRRRILQRAALVMRTARVS